jgi:transcriptional regulator with XRE-family HTH domain
MSVTIPVFTYGDRLRRARLDTGLTQQQFAEQIGVTQAIISRHEMMDAPPTRNRRVVALLVQMRYGVPSDWLLTGVVPPQRTDVTRRYHTLTGRPVLHLVGAAHLRNEKAAA